YNMPDGHGGLSAYDCNKIYRLLISSSALYALTNLGLSCNRLTWEVREPQRNAEQFVTVYDVVDEGRVDDTYCFNEPKRHMGVFNGILTGNCSEIALHSSTSESFVCVLASMNLLHYEEWKNTDAVEVLTYFLDTVVTDFLNSIERLERTDRDAAIYMHRAYNFAKKHRALGLGALGWHSYLQSNHLSFESQEAAKKNLEIHKHIEEHSWNASRELSQLFGEPELLAGYGRRNTTLTAIAPTKSSSFILGQVSP